MRAVCFVKRIEFQLEENIIYQNTMTLGDVDNDGNNELVIGYPNGDISIYKHELLWQSYNGLGMITSIAVGDIFNCNENSLVVIGGDGWCHILFKKELEEGAGSAEVPKLQSVHIQRIPANTKIALLGDIDGDGKVELVLGLTDRVVRSYRWVPDSADKVCTGKLVGINKWECADQIGGMTLHYTPAGTPCLLVAQPGGTYMKICIYKDIETDEDTERDEDTVNYQGDAGKDDVTEKAEDGKKCENTEKTEKSEDTTKYDDAKHEDVEKYEETETPGDTRKYDDTRNYLDAGKYLDARKYEEPGIYEETGICEDTGIFDDARMYEGKEKANNGEESTNSFVSYHPLASSRMRNDNISTEILGCIRPPGVPVDDNTSMRYIVATLDGTLMLLDDDDILWSIQVDHQLFSLSKLDVTGDGTEEIIACSWDGQTYILDQERRSVRFQFEEPVSAFCAGQYTVNSTHVGVPCFVYATFSNTIYIYYDIKIPHVQTHAFQVDTSATGTESLSKSDMQRLVEWTLYGGKNSL